MSKRLENKKPGPEKPVEKVERRCLACGRKFVARGRYERLCRDHRHGEPCDKRVG